MNDKRILVILLVFVWILTACSVRNPKVLIIGDSISIGYTPYTKAYFSDKAIIVHNPGNAQHTGTGLEKINEWIGNQDWDIIQFNWGLWDLCYRHPNSKVYGNRDKINGRITYAVEDYSSNLDSLVTILKQTTNAKLIFVTTTYVPKNEAGRFEADAVKYNEAAKRVMKKHSIVVNDIYVQSISIHKEFGKGPGDVHYKQEGYERLSELVNGFLENELKK